MANSFSINQLDKGPQDLAVKDFIDFYVRKFKQNSMEILAMYKVDYYMADINTFIYENRSYFPEQLNDELFINCGGNFVEIIKEVNPEYNADGSIVGSSWDEWHEEQFNKVSVRD